MLPLIGLEEHYASRAVFPTNRGHDFYLSYPPALLNKLTDLGELRLKDMEVGKTTLQLISYVPNQLSVAESHIANQEVYEGVKAHPDRFKAFATLRIVDVAEAVKELTRCVKEFGFLGALIPCHLKGEFYDNERFWPIFEKAQELDVPIYLHPTYATNEMVETQYSGNFNSVAESQIGMMGLGWHQQLVIGHMGEMLPFQRHKILRYTNNWGNWKRGFQEVWDNNLWITTSGMFSLAPMACLLRTTKIERILYSVDFPFGPQESGLKFMENLRASGLVTDDGFEAIAYKNAEKLLKFTIGKTSS